MVTFGGTDVVNAARVGGVCAGFAPPSETSTDEAIDGLELKDLPRFGARVKILQDFWPLPVELHYSLHWCSDTHTAKSAYRYVQ